MPIQTIRNTCPRKGVHDRKIRCSFSVPLIFPFNFLLSPSLPKVRNVPLAAFFISFHSPSLFPSLFGIRCHFAGTARCRLGGVCLYKRPRFSIARRASPPPIEKKKRSNRRIRMTRANPQRKGHTRMLVWRSSAGSAMYSVPLH